jgi:hypothetical protein
MVVRHFLLSYSFMLFDLGLCERHMTNQRVNTLDELSAWITAGIANVTRGS